jgi:LysR family transcriptional regulator (chromosome initiation inhibitor)
LIFLIFFFWYRQRPQVSQPSRFAQCIQYGGKAKKSKINYFNRRDELHLQYFTCAFDHPPEYYPAHYLPSAERFVTFIADGLACGMLPDQQSRPLLDSGRLVDLKPACHVPVGLFWHCWNLKSNLLEAFSHHLMEKARAFLPP